MGPKPRNVRRAGRHCAFTLGWIAVSCAGFGGNARAQTLSGARADPPLRLNVVLLDAAEPPSLKSRLQSWFPDGTSLAVETRAPSSSSASSAFDGDTLAIWIAMPSADRADITYGFRDPTSRRLRFVQSQISLQGGLDELGQERLARVIHTSVMALLEGRVAEVGVSLDTPPSQGHPARAAAVPPVSPSEFPDAAVIGAAESIAGTPSVRILRGSLSVAPIHRLRPGWLGVAYAMTLRGREGMALGPALTLGWRAMRLQHSSYGLFLESRFIIPSSFAFETLRIQTSGARVRLAAQLETRFGQSWSLELGLGAGIDVNHYVVAQSSDPSIEPSQPGTDTQLCVTPSLRLWTVAPLEIGLGAHLDLLPTNGRYTTSTSDSLEARVIAPWRLQPGISFTLRWPGQSP